MKQLHLLLGLLFLFVAGVTPALAQNRTVNGKVADAGGQSVIGATVAAKGSNVTTLTNSEGIFSITVPSGTERLIISSVGFASKEVLITGKTDISVTLNISTAELSEVIVTALGVERNKKIATVFSNDCRR